MHGMHRSAWVLLAGLVVTACVTERKYQSENSGVGGNGSGMDAGGTPTVVRASEEACADYCGEIVTGCREDSESPAGTIDVQAYENEAACNAFCLHLPAGDPDDPLPQDDSLACRAQQAVLANTSGEPDVHCPSAGPGGNGRCGDACEVYCSLRDEICGGLASEQEFLFTSDDCKRRCGGLVDAETNNVNDYYGGDTLQCRINHLVAGSQPGGATEHCPHTRINPLYDEGPSPCSDTDAEDPSFHDLTCAGYCKLVMTACTGDLAVYESQSDCEEVCNDTDIIDTGAPEDREGNSATCRRYHAYVALGDPITHCRHAGPTGDGTCSPEGEGNCPAHCRLLAKACPDRYSEEFMPDGESTDDAYDACITQCEDVDGADANSKYSRALAVGDEAAGDTLQCRTWYAVLARAERPTDTEPDDAEYCAAAFGESPCE